MTENVVKTNLWIISKSLAQLQTMMETSEQFQKGRLKTRSYGHKVHTVRGCRTMHYEPCKAEYHVPPLFFQKAEWGEGKKYGQKLVAHSYNLNIFNPTHYTNS